MEHPEGDVVFRHACKMGLEGIVSKAPGVALPVGEIARLVQVEDPEAPAVRREAQEDWRK